MLELKRIIPFLTKYKDSKDLKNCLKYLNIFKEIKVINLYLIVIYKIRMIY